MHAYKLNEVCVCWLDEDLYTIGPAVSMDSGYLFALNGAASNTLVHVQLPANICALFHSELDCSAHIGCIFCSNYQNETYCDTAVDELPVG